MRKTAAIVRKSNECVVSGKFKYISLNSAFHRWLLSVNQTYHGLQMQTRTGLQLVGSRPFTARLP